MQKKSNGELTEQEKAQIKALYLHPDSPVGVSTIATKLRILGSRIDIYLKKEGIKRGPKEALKLKVEKKIVYHDPCSHVQREENWLNGKRSRKISL